ETDDTGAYRLFGLAGGDYIVGIQGNRWNFAPGTPGVTPLTRDGRPYEYYPRASRNDEAQILVISAGTEVAGIDLTLSLPSPQPTSGRLPSTPIPPEKSGVIRGRVVRADGFPARNVRVRLSSADRFFTPFATFSTDEGLYEFLGLSPGRYQIAVDPDI